MTHGTVSAHTSGRWDVWSVRTFVPALRRRRPKSAADRVPKHPIETPTTDTVPSFLIRTNNRIDAAHKAKQTDSSSAAKSCKIPPKKS